MDLVSDHPWWAVRNGLLAAYPALDRDERCDVAVLGAGISGALVAESLSRAGLDVVVLDGRDVAQGSTAASTALLQYEIDVHLADLIPLVGQDSAVRAYQLCRQAIDQLERLAGELPLDCDFERKRSLYAASRRRDIAGLREEFDARVSCGIPVEFLEAEQIASEFGIEVPAAILSQEAAVCDAFRLTHGLLQLCQQRGVRIHDRTLAESVQFSDNEVTVKTDRGAVVRANWLVRATGYEAATTLRKKIVSLNSTYAIISQPLVSFAPWPEDCLFWESARPYLYLRTTSDHRLLAGGLDDPFRNPALRDRRIHRKSQKILQRVSKLLPQLELECEYAWAGTFGETKDGLPYIGPHPRHPRELYALGFGGNGITFSVIAADILRDLVRGIPNPDAEIFRFNR